MKIITVEILKKNNRFYIIKKNINKGRLTKI